MKSIIYLGAISKQLHQGQELEFDMKYHILHDFRTSTPFKEESCHHFKDLQRLKLLTDIDVDLNSLPGGFMNNVLNI